MKVAIIEVKKCSGCPHCSYIYHPITHYQCNKLGGKKVNGKTIDQDCPLPEKDSNEVDGWRRSQ